MHCDFGEAAHLSGSIIALLDAGAFSPVETAVFAAQAGAHLAANFDGTGDELAPVHEKRLLFDTCAAYLAKGAEFNDAERAYVGSELRKCVRVASLAMVNATGRAFGTAAPVWDGLAQQRRYSTYSDAVPIARRQTAVLDELEVYVGRLRLYERYLNALPKDEDGDSGAKWRASLSESVRDWSAEISRLRTYV